jgi:hypothetical protein
MSGMSDTQLDYLDAIAAEVRQGKTDRVGPLSTGESLYVALAGNDVAMLQRLDYTIPQAISRVGQADIDAMVERWRYK